MPSSLLVASHDLKTKMPRLFGQAREKKYYKPKLFGGLRRRREANRQTKVNGRALENTHSACTVSDLISITARKTHSHAHRHSDFCCIYLAFPLLFVLRAIGPLCPTSKLAADESSAASSSSTVTPCPPVMGSAGTRQEELLPFHPPMLKQGGVCWWWGKEKKQRSGLSDGNASRKGFCLCSSCMLPITASSYLFFFLFPLSPAF
ncbi:hypothetical protein J3F84DRAFT_364183 [Trichoderma pleuroticola]